MTQGRWAAATDTHCGYCTHAMTSHGPSTCTECGPGIYICNRRVMTPATVTPVPNQEKTPRRTVRVPDDVWRAAQVKAAERGETVTDVIVRALRRYGKS